MVLQGARGSVGSWWFCRELVDLEGGSTVFQGADGSSYA